MTMTADERAAAERTRRFGAASSLAAEALVQARPWADVLEGDDLPTWRATWPALTITHWSWSEDGDDDATLRLHVRLGDLEVLVGDFTAGGLVPHAHVVVAASYKYLEPADLNMAADPGDAYEEWSEMLDTLEVLRGLVIQLVDRMADEMLYDLRKSLVFWLERSVPREATGQGDEPAAGVKMVVAANHWELALRSHASNHNDADHTAEECEADAIQAEYERLETAAEALATRVDELERAWRSPGQNLEVAAHQLHEPRARATVAVLKARKALRVILDRATGEGQS